MNKNREKYQRSINALHLSDDFREQIKSIPEDNGKGKIMKFRSVYGISRVAAAVATVCTLALGSAGACFACDVGGIRTNFNLWVNGNLQNVDAYDAGDGSYVIYDEDGDAQRAMGGMVVDENGNQTQMSAEELVGYMNNDCYLEQNDEGRMIFYYKNLQMDVTDLIDKKGNLYIHVEDPSNEYTYFTISDITDHGYSSEAGRTTSFGKDYYELDATDLVITDVNEVNADDATTSYSFVTSD